MVVDDEAIITTQLEDRLSLMGYDVFEGVSSGQQAVEMAKQLNPDVILMDIVMPGRLNGIDAAERIKNELGIPVIFLTAYSDDAFLKKATNTMPYGYIVKPFQEREIKGAIEVALHRKRLERELQQQRLFADSLVETAQAIILVLDTQGHIVRYNSYMEDISGYKLEETKGKDWFSTFLPPGDHDRIRRLFKRAVGNMKTRGNVNPIVCRNGEYRDIEWYNKTLRDGEGNLVGLLAIGQDVTERRRDAKEKEQLREHLRQAEKMQALGQLAGGIAHDFNNQLGGIIGNADLLREKVADDPKLTRYADNILLTAFRSADLTKKMLAFARKGKYQVVTVDIHKIIFEVVSILQHSIDKRITIKQHLVANPATTKGDSTQIQNAILNIAINARDAMPNGGELSFTTGTRTLGQSECQDHSFAGEPGDYVYISIFDTGIGMDDETKSHVFEPFFTTKDVDRGTGMGLASAYGTIKNHGGLIKVESEPGHGTEMQIWLPLTQRKEETALKPDEAKPQEGSAHVLIVDDNEIVRNIASEILRKNGYKVTNCKDGKEAVEYYRKSWEFVDLVILDMVMPELGGRDTFVAMRQINPKVKAILSSGYTIDGEVKTILDEGILSFLQKPFRSAGLCKAVTEALDPGKQA